MLLARSAEAHSSAVVITMDADGFTPNQVTIDQNQTVTFVNEDKQDHWPASNLHPTHDLYPQFDPTAPVQPGESWKFQANEAGSWDYHDHLSPQLRGQLIVTLEESPAARISSLLGRWLRGLKSLIGLWTWTATNVELPEYTQMQDASAYIRDVMTACFQGGGRNDCYKTAAARLFREFGLEESLTLFAQNEADPDVYARCHEVTHYLSRHEFERTGSIPQVYAACDSTCHGGCYHGALEAYLARTARRSTYDDVEKEFPQICGSRGDYANQLIFNECHHGLGHAAMFVTDSDIYRSLALCDKLPTLAMRENCYSGVFMENSSSSTNLDHPSAYIKADDPYFPCNGLQERYLKICYRYQSSHFSLITKHDWKKVADLCMGVPAQYQNECFRTVGTNQVGFTHDMNTWLANCASMPATYQATCVTGVVSSLAYRFVGDVKKTEDFCAQTAPALQEPCFNQLGTAVREWSESASQRQDWCASLSSAGFRRWCSEGLDIADHQNLTLINK